MTDALPVVTLCLADPICLSASTAGLSSLVAVARRLQSMDSLPRSRRSWSQSCRTVFVGGTYTWSASFAICYAGSELWPSHLNLVASGTILVAIALDWSSESAARLLRVLLRTIASTYLREISRDEDPAPEKRPPTSSKDGPTSGP